MEEKKNNNVYLLSSAISKSVLSFLGLLTWNEVKGRTDKLNDHAIKQKQMQIQ